ncbi:uncharacterized protein LOC100878897 [Megachile rotundata]|uniref:uncharacterized protein LOC100878897 n=1 Tax=Megachile rotundata TaxID=143995 RepID=UPI000614CFD9|nr:PREDICTED: uncharacterized protein LOC100878897 [Megachile rotundata]XP_012144515.1 PREDICTED: uncharacterized protein LOC100878897 [Megachile rotundata]XP_012144516.1 PREDICTED: uncharacterized protein LOC100878897 [Megachile rotundata]XP_012144517.1 PREDICTED: uncharacterized protein LOC100878897 [Megachile rotundata]
MSSKMQSSPWILLMALACIAGVSSEYLMGGHMDNNAPKSLLEEMESSPTLARTAQLDDLDLDLDAEESTVLPSTSTDEEAPRYHLPYPFAFNGGRPFSLEKDPISGKIDFEKAPPVKALNYSSRYQEHANSEEQGDKEPLKENTQKKVENKESVDVSPNEINPYSPNFHDFLNLPVHYSSDKYGKDKYPLISSSYANTKVQSGSNSYSTYNHKPYHGETVAYYHTRKPYVPKTSSTTTMSSTTTSTSTTTTTTTTTTTPKPTTSTTTTTTTTTTPPPSTTSTTTKTPPVTTWKPSSTTPKRFMDHLDEYDDILPIEKLQASMYNNNHQGANNIMHNRDPPTNHEEYIDSYEDYEMNDGEDYVSKDSTNEIVKTSTLPATTSTVANVTATTAGTPETPSSTTTVASTTTSLSPNMHFSSMLHEDAHQSNSVPFQSLPQRPVTSMPLDNDHRLPSAFENDSRRQGVADNVIVNQNYRPNMIGQRPSGLGGILVESTSNIVIPPDQDTVSFVLGNRQNVEGGYYSVGTAIGENPYSAGIDTSFRPLYGVQSDKGNYDPQTDHRGTFGLPLVPAPENPSYAAQTWRQPNPSATQKIANEIEPSRPQGSFVKGTVLLDQMDDKKDDKDVNFVVFPKDEPKQPVEEHIVIVNEADGTVHEIAPSSSTMKPMRVNPPVPNEEHLPQLSEDLTPPTERPRPPSQFHYHYHHGGITRPDHLRPQRPPVPPRGKPSPAFPPPLPPPTDPAGIRRRPYSPDSNLPNILPQFRPNAKTSHGHRGSETIGTIPAGQTYSTRIRQPVQSHPPTRRPLPPPPSYLQRLNPPPPPIHALRLAGAASTKTENVMPLRDTEPVKRFRPPPIPATSRGEDDVKLAQRLSSQKLRLEEEERLERYSEEPPQVPPRPPLFPKRRTADHVATLQMIQHHGEFEEDVTESAGTDDESDRIVTEQNADKRKFDENEPIAEAPVYVVYPVNTAVNIHPDDSREKDESVVVGTRGPHRPLPPETLLQDNEEQEMDEEQGPVVQNVFSSRPVASDFPYPLERPDPSVLVTGMRETPLLVPSDQRREESVKESSDEKDEKDSSVNVIPYLQDFVPFPARKNEPISATLYRLPSTPTSTPIAFVYTPTAQASHRLDVDVRDDKDNSKTDRNDQKPVLLPSQQPSSSSSSAPSPQNFMAPFVASVSAEAPSKNGWSVVMVEPVVNRKSDEDRDSMENPSDTEESQTEKNEFDAENFKPQLFGGFKPIYEFPTQDEDQPERRESSDANSEVSTSDSQSANSTV